MIVLGLDPGTLKMGWALVESGYSTDALAANGSGKGIRRLRSGVLKAKASSRMEQRLSAISSALQDIVTVMADADTPINAVAVEGGFFGRDAQSGLKIGMARAIAYILAGDFDVPLKEYANNTVKKAIAQRGNAEKADVMRAVNELFPGPPETRIVDEDESDALAVAVTHLNTVEGVTMMERLAARGPA